MSESVSTGVWCVPGFGAGFEIALEPSELQKEGENPGKALLFSAPNPGVHQTLVQKKIRGMCVCVSSVSCTCARALTHTTVA